MTSRLLLCIPGPDHFLLENFLLDLLVHRDFYGNRLAHDSLSKLPAVIPEILHLDDVAFHDIFKSHPRDIITGGLEELLPILIPSVPVSACAK